MRRLLSSKCWRRSGLNEAERAWRNLFRLAKLRYNALCAGVCVKGLLMSEKFSADWWEKFRASPLSQETNGLRASSQTELVARITAAALNGQTDRKRSNRSNADREQTQRLARINRSAFLILFPLRSACLAKSRDVAPTLNRLFS